MTLFPAVSSLAEYEAIRRDDARFRPGAAAIVASLGLASHTLDRFPDGSLPVYAVGEELVLKLYPPFERSERDHETAALAAISGRLPIPTPAVHATGEFETWSYLLMGRLHGRGLDELWPELSPAERRDLCTQLGEGLRELHALRGPTLDPLRIDWPDFLAEQRRTAVERQRRRGLEERWCERIPAFLDRAFEPAPADSLLHTEIMRDHLLAERTPGGWRLSGLFDFEPAMVGAVEYEFVSAGLFVTDGDPVLFGRLLGAYGLSGAELGPAAPRRLMAWCLLHRYSNLPWFLRRLSPPAGTVTLEELAERWFQIEGAT